MITSGIRKKTLRQADLSRQTLGQQKGLPTIEIGKPDETRIRKTDSEMDAAEEVTGAVGAVEAEVAEGVAGTETENENRTARRMRSRIVLQGMGPNSV